MVNKDQKKILVLKMSKDIANAGTLNIMCNANQYGMEYEEKVVTSNEELEAALNCGKKYDYLYIAGHGGKECVGENGGFIVPWAELGSKLCKSNCLNEDAILLLYCCRGGLNQVAYTLFAACTNIQYVCGCRQSARNIDLMIGFNVFVYNIECRHIDPVLAADKATVATENRFMCFDRLEVEADPMYYYHYCPDCVSDAPEQEEVIDSEVYPSAVREAIDVTPTQIRDN